MNKRITITLLSLIIVSAAISANAMEKPAGQMSQAIGHTESEYKNAIPTNQQINELRQKVATLHILTTDEDLARLSPQENELWDAIEGGHYARLKEALAEQASPNAKMADYTPLARAIVSLDTNAVEILLETGADPKQKSYGMTSVEWAKYGLLHYIDRYLEIIEILKEQSKGAVSPAHEKLKERPIFRPR